MIPPSARHNPSPKVSHIPDPADHFSGKRHNDFSRFVIVWVRRTWSSGGKTRRKSGRPLFSACILSTG
jgi:hypothetical protein